jgi:RND family efflux transporter MFP subunit
VIRTVLLVPLPLVAGCGGSGPQGAAPQGPPPAAVKLVTVEDTAIEDATEYVATLKSLRSTNIQPQVEGQITRILVKSGDRVKAGAPLVEIDPQQQQATVSSQQAELAAQEASVAFARDELARNKQLHADGIVSKQVLEQAQTTLNTAEGQLSALRAKVKEEQVRLHYFSVQAPTAGTVGDVPVRVGNYVTSQTVLTTIEQNATLELYVQVPVERAPDLKLGLPIQLIDESDEAPVSTTISFISPSVDTVTQSVLAKGLLRNDGGTLRSSQFVRARIVWKSYQGLLLPVIAVVRLSGQAFAFVAEEKDGTLVARQRPVRLGQVVKDDYVVLDGLKPGDRVVVSGIQRLIDGAPLAPQES